MKTNASVAIIAAQNFTFIEVASPLLQLREAVEDLRNDLIEASWFDTPAESDEESNSKNSSILATFVTIQRKSNEKMSQLIIFTLNEFHFFVVLDACQHKSKHAG